MIHSMTIGVDGSTVPTSQARLHDLDSGFKHGKPGGEANRR